MLRLSSGIILFGAALLVFTAAAAAAGADLQVTATEPARNTAASIFTNVRVTFDRPVNPASLTPSTFRVFGRWSGPKTGTFAFSNGNRTVTFDPARAFSAGEVVFVNLSHGVTAEDLTTLRNAGYAFLFKTATAPSNGQFQQIDVMSNRTCCQTRIYGASASDLDEDGYLDLTTVNEVSGDVRVFLNRGDGTGLYEPFLSPQDIGDEASPNEPADFNNDGHSDLCVAASSSNSIWILLGAGDGTFSSITEIPTGNDPHGITTLDVDGDGDLDVVNANRGTNNLALFLNNGSGVFGAASFFEGGVNAEYGLASGDMNNDGITDLVVAGRDGQHLVTQLGNGNGTFTAAGPAQPSGGSTWVVVVDDLNGDRNLDASTANSFSNNAARLLGNGDGTFGAPVTVSIGAHTVATDHGDLDGDGDADWVVSSFGGHFWRVYRNDGAGNFTFDQQIAAPSNPSCAVLIDFDNDGDLDMALTDEIADVIVLRENTGTGSVDPESPPATVSIAPNRPNPFRSGTILRFGLPERAVVTLDVFDAGGRRVATRSLGEKEAGWQDFPFDGRDDTGRSLSDGVYFYRVGTAVGEQVGRLNVIR